MTTNGWLSTAETYFLFQEKSQVKVSVRLVSFGGSEGGSVPVSYLLVVAHKPEWEAGVTWGLQLDHSCLDSVFTWPSSMCVLASYKGTRHT